ncbi:MAG: hypothetical protein H6819_08695 [Phycisphaerales bacterium]|nr:hypothetical protein [Phycisphaerales bacterium]MCB9855691.1 hypothetical protein [Phycisphaerales bacterium]MCB9862586.1 hypothetical protein [Phycisphaerales bacterium]
MNPHIRTIATAASITLAACLSVPLALLLAAVCFGLRKREPWMLSDDVQRPARE